MKTFIFLPLAMLLAMASGAFATVLTVSNNANSPGQYTSIQDAVNAAGFNGDTIMVAGSPTNYGHFTIDRKIVLVGAGYNNPYGYSTSVGNIYLSRANSYISSTKSKIMGFVIGTVFFRGNPWGGSLIDSIMIERCWVGTLNFESSYYSSADTIRNCIICNGTLQLRNYSCSNLVLHNNILDNVNINSDGTAFPTVFIRNNVFIDHSSPLMSNGPGNSLIFENNIFFGAEPTGCTNCVFTKNITYLCTSLPGSGNLGSGNIAADPMFVNFPPLGGGFSYSYDFHLQAGSPGKNAGTDGTDIGIYGGMLPFEVGANPHFPQMMTLTLPNGSSVPAGGTLNVHFTARKQN